MLNPIQYSGKSKIKFETVGMPILVIVLRRISARKHDRRQIRKPFRSDEMIQRCLIAHARDRARVNACLNGMVHIPLKKAVYTRMTGQHDHD